MRKLIALIMKLFILAILMLSSTLAFSAAKCPSDTDTFKTCRVAGEPGDSELALGTFDSITICNQGGRSLLVLEKNRESEIAAPMITSRVGGISYVIDDGKVDFIFNLITGVRNQATLKARFLVVNKDTNTASAATYTCR